jgi:predicted O-methyltransferase YrrM
MFFQLKKYISHKLKQKSKYKIHSPFVYKLINNCTKIDRDNNFNHNFNRYKNVLIKNKSKIQITDLGAGSNQLNKDFRKVCDIAKNAGITNKNAHFLHQLIRYFKCTDILEIGTSLGLGTYSMSKDKNTNVTTLEGCKSTLQIAKQQLEINKIKNVNFVLGDFNNTLKTVLNKKYDLIYFDGNHQKEATINYFEQCLDTVHNNTIFIFDDIYWSKEMSLAWQHIKNHAKVKLTIDTFYWGIVFFRKEQFEKEHFVIKL